MATGISFERPDLLQLVFDIRGRAPKAVKQVVQILKETTPSADLVATDAAILIPMLSSLSKDEVLPIFPWLIDLPLDKFQTALARILQVTALV
ncbi:hypothetical protein QJS10_CPB17g02401 [Acorus calamus]|uniref:Symplekin C-terminal domain-containing protein n=1 Tax=Acorus calamus TaxID=4465 RepID=A0AAV9CUE1_ACOCL|nr:hypothetical protein QJS10_CPB17g02401 [Acorus calamus]